MPGQFEIAQAQAAGVAARIERRDLGLETDWRCPAAAPPPRSRADRGSCAAGRSARSRPSRRTSISSPSSKHSSRSCVTSRIGTLNSARTCRSTAYKLGAQRRIQAARRLIEQQQLRLADQRARDGAALLLSARDLMRAPAGDVRQLKPLQHFVDAAMPLQARPALGGEHQVLRAASCAETARSSGTRSRSCAACGRQVDARTRRRTGSRRPAGCGRHRASTKPAMQSSVSVLPAPLARTAP